MPNASTTPIGSRHEQHDETHPRRCKTGQDVQFTARDGAVVLSLALQHGTPIETIRHAVTRDKSGEGASILGAIVDALPMISTGN